MLIRQRLATIVNMMLMFYVDVRDFVCLLMCHLNDIQVKLIQL